jgi:hypothetical protein
MGRVNRRAENPPAPITIAAKALNRHILYDSERTRSTLNLLRNLSGPASEQDIARICNQVYVNGYEGDELATFKERLEHKYLTRFEDNIIAGDHENWVERIIEVENRLDVLPTSLRTEHGQLISERRWLEADALTVNIRLSKNLDQYLHKEHDPWLINLPYTADGLVIPSQRSLSDVRSYFPA